MLVRPVVAAEDVRRQRTRTCGVRGRRQRAEVLEAPGRCTFDNNIDSDRDDIRMMGDGAIEGEIIKRRAPRRCGRTSVGDEMLEGPVIGGGGGRAQLLAAMMLKNERLLCYF